MIVTVGGEGIGQFYPPNYYAFKDPHLPLHVEKDNERSSILYL